MKAILFDNSDLKKLKDLKNKFVQSQDYETSAKLRDVENVLLNNIDGDSDKLLGDVVNENLKSISHKNTLKLLVLTKNCGEQEREELLNYIGELENLLDETQMILKNTLSFKNKLDIFLDRK